MTERDSGHATTAPSENTSTTRQPSQLLVLLAGAGTPPLDVEQVRIAPIRLFDAFVLPPERLRLFCGAPGALFPSRAGASDPRHDPIARALRHIVLLLRPRLEAHEQSEPAIELVRNVEALAASRIEAHLSGFDPRTGLPSTLNAGPMLGRLDAGVDPLEVNDAGVLRRLLSLISRGLQVDKSRRPRGASVVNDLGGLALALGLLDVAANPRSALRAARRRAVKSGRLDARGTASVHDVGLGLREVLSQAVSAATSTGAAGRDLVKDTSLPSDILEHLAVGLARCIYDGLAPEHEHPLVVPGVADGEAFTAAPVLVRTPSESPVVEPVLGLYNRIAFVELPYARRSSGDIARAGRESEPPRPPRVSAINDAAFARAREIVRPAASLVPAGPSLFVAQVDALDGRHAWRPVTLDLLPRQIVKSVEAAPAAAHVVILLGTRTEGCAHLVDALAPAIGAGQSWYVLAPRTTDLSLVFEPMPNDTSAREAFRRADAGRWLEPGVLRSVHWDLPDSARAVINAASLDEISGAAVETLLAIAGDAAHRVRSRGMLLVVGAPSYAHAASVLAALGRHPDLESGSLPVRSSQVWLVRTDVPIPGRRENGSGGDESAISAVAESLLSAGPLSEIAVRAAVAPNDAKYKGRLVRIAALTGGGGAQFADARRALERAALEPNSGASMRRALQAGVGTQWTTRAAAQAGFAPEVASCIRHEAALLLAEWDEGRARAAPSRIADLARGMLVEPLLAASSRASIVLADSIYESLPGGCADFTESTSDLGPEAHACGLRAGGTVYARDGGREVVPLSVMFRGTAVDVHAMIDIVNGGGATRAVAGGHVVLSLRPPATATPSISIAAVVIAGVSELVRRCAQPGAVLVHALEQKSRCGLVCEVVIQDTIAVEQIRVIVPLRKTATERDAIAVGIDLVARASDLFDTDTTGEWSVQACLDDGRPLNVPVGPAIALRDLPTRWFRALRLFSRTFPGNTGDNGRYDEVSQVESGVQLGVPSALERARGAGDREVTRRVAAARLGSVASSIGARIRDFATRMPFKSQALEGDELIALERFLVIGWWLYSNFCVTDPGSVTWSNDGLEEAENLVEKFLDRQRLKVWLQRKKDKPEHVLARVEALTNYFEPTIVVD